ncbi:hypothetical protein [Streptomyces violaceusniger]|uniref:ATP-binding protein n=1 Tax=Streptomyces violaceusniger (strain Tu 4113) TaxID=653045 RepID=G2PHF0_STRV4|nr:hypothetical protein [Streptomyces violaceusniger]AEM88796.1 hypothetical protein Strvi_0019 [Streptomyces violaceusniger Tu 4113]
MKKTIATALAIGAALAAGAGVAHADPRVGDTASHSTDAVTGVLNGDASAVGNLRLPAKAAVPAVVSKVGPHQGANENAAPQADGDLLPIVNGGAIPPLS